MKTSMAVLIAAGAALAQFPQSTVNPAIKVETVPMPGNYSTMGMAFLPDGRMALATIDNPGDFGQGALTTKTANDAVYIVSGLSGTMSPTVKKVADMFYQPSGLVVAEGKVYLSDRDAFYRIEDIENPGTVSANRTKLMDWPTPEAGYDWNRGPYGHQWVFTPMYYGGKFYAPYSGSIRTGGVSDAPPTTTYSGAFFSWPVAGGAITKVNGGLRSPNGAGLGANGMMLVSDNQGGWYPACQVAMMKPGKFYGHRQNTPHKPNWAQEAVDAGTMTYEPALAWLVDGAVGESSSQPLYLPDGPYAGDWIIGDVNNPALARISLDQVGANYQGAVFFFTGGLLNGGTVPAVNRLVWNPADQTVFVGTSGPRGNWPFGANQPMFRLSFTKAAVFEMLSVHSVAGGVQVDFSQPVNPSTAVNGSFTLSQWHYNRTSEYGCCIDQRVTPTVSGVKLASDNRSVTLQISGGGTAALDRLLQVNAPGIRSATGGALLHSTTWFTHNYQGTTVRVEPRPAQAKRLDGALSFAVARPGVLEVNVDLAGDYRVSLRSLAGILVEEREASAPGKFTLAAARHGLYVLQLKQGRHISARPVML